MRPGWARPLHYASLHARSQVIYLAKTDFSRLDLYRSLALALGLEPAYRRASLWRQIKARIEELADAKGVTVVWIIDLC